MALVSCKTSPTKIQHSRLWNEIGILNIQFSYNWPFDNDPLSASYLFRVA